MPPRVAPVDVGVKLRVEKASLDPVGARLRLVGSRFVFASMEVTNSDIAVQLVAPHQPL